MRYYAQETDIYGEGKTYGDKTWDADKNYGCVCDEFYSGYDCSLRDCPTGDDPMTSGQANEIQDVVCEATEGTFTLTFYKQGPPFRPMTTPPIKFDATSAEFTLAFYGIATVSITYSFGTQACVAGNSKNVITIEFKQDFGDLPVMIVGGDQKSTVEIFGAAPDYGATGEQIQAGDGNFYAPVKGTKENLPCSRRGYCDTLTGVCTCYTAFQTSDGEGKAGPRGDCGSPKGGITACPGTSLACSGHGYCLGSPTFQCVCSAGYTGGDCSERTCPTGYSWFDTPVAEDDAHYKVECSNMGICDKTKGECRCRTNFEGAACERMSCPGGDPTCSGHGRCYSMAQLAENSVDHSNGALTTFTYGKIPNYKYTWDYDKVWGCQCDADYTGYDCSQRVCPRGDDPITGNGNGPNDPVQVKEIQTISCMATSGVFRLRFRGYETADLSWDSTIYDVEKAIEGLQSTGGPMGATWQGDVIVEVTKGHPTGCNATACCAYNSTANDPSLPETWVGNKLTIYWISELGNLPPLVVTKNELGQFNNGTGASRWYTDDEGPVSISVATQRDGTTENAECSNRGICNRATGICACFAGFGSSNGNGRFSIAGDRGDCGYVMPVYTPEAT
jgi:hypothetical protein